MSEERPRVRVTAQSALDADRAPQPAAVDPRSAYLRSLMRSQLRLALYCLAAFVGLLAAFIATIAYFHELGEIHLLGIPLSWWLLGFGIYPLIVTTAVIYVRAARRNETTFRQLIELEHTGESESLS